MSPHGVAKNNWMTWPKAVGPAPGMLSMMCFNFLTLWTWHWSRLSRSMNVADDIFWLRKTSSVLTLSTVENLHVPRVTQNWYCFHFLSMIHCQWQLEVETRFNLRLMLLILILLYFEFNVKLLRRLCSLRYPNIKLKSNQDSEHTGCCQWTYPMPDTCKTCQQETSLNCCQHWKHSMLSEHRLKHLVYRRTLPLATLFASNLADAWRCHHGTPEQVWTQISLLTSFGVL